MDKFNDLQSAISVKFTPELLEKVLKEHSKCKDVEVVLIEFGTPTKKGDSYLSEVTRFTIHYIAWMNRENNFSKDGIIHMIGKALIRNIARRKSFRCHDFFRNEFNFYEKVWPEMQRFQKEMKIDDIFSEIPNYLCGHIDGENDFILLEDLSFEGYKGLDRSKALSFEMTKVILQLFARFHGLGFAYKHLNPESYHKTTIYLEETYYAEKFRAWYSNFHTLLKNICLDSVEKQSPAKYLTKLKEVFQLDTFEEACKSCVRKSKFSTIVHGDSWIPNIMMRFSPESEQPERSLLIDFQLTRFASIALDLHLFFYGCTGVKLWPHFDELLIYYCHEFNQFVAQFFEDKKLAPRLTIEELDNELKTDGYFGLCMAMEAVIMSVIDDNDINDEELQGDEAVPIETVWTLKPLKCESKRIRIAQFIQHMIDRKFI